MKKYYVDDEEVSYDDFTHELDNAIDTYSDDTFDSYLNDKFDWIEIDGMTFYPSQILSELNYIKYDNLKDERLSQLKEEFFKELDNGEELNINDYWFKVVEIPVETPIISKMRRIKHQETIDYTDQIIEYKGFTIERNFYGNNEYSFQFCGDDLMFNTLEEAKEEIDDILENG